MYVSDLTVAIDGCCFADFGGRKGTHYIAIRKEGKLGIGHKEGLLPYTTPLHAIEQLTTLHFITLIHPSPSSIHHQYCFVGKLVLP